VGDDSRFGHSLFPRTASRHKANAVSFILLDSIRRGIFPAYQSRDEAAFLRRISVTGIAIPPCPSEALS